MPSVNTALADHAVGHKIDLLRYDRTVIYRMIAVLNRSDARLSAALTEALLQIDRNTFTVERLESLLQSVRAINASAWQAVHAELEPALRDAAQIESGYQLATLKASVPAVVQLQFPVAALSAEQVYAAALARPFQGRLLSGWMASLEESRAKKIREAVRQGYVEGRTTGEIIQTIRGTRALKYADGALEISRREAAAVVQTALSATAQFARREFYKANADLVKAAQWVSTLDNRTTPECAARDGYTYSPESHDPLDGGPPWLGGPGALHFNCRSVDVPVLKSWKELGIDIEELPAGTRASMDGQVPADLTYPEWFARQSAARQDEIVGPTRGALYRDGKVKFDQFTDDKGRFLTLPQMRERAGLTIP